MQQKQIFSVFFADISSKTNLLQLLQYYSITSNSKIFHMLQPVLQRLLIHVAGIETIVVPQ
jgi:hypothetical protein